MKKTPTPADPDSVTVLETANDHEVFFDALDTPPAPTDALREAFKKCRISDTWNSLSDEERKAWLQFLGRAINLLEGNVLMLEKVTRQKTGERTDH